MKKLLRGYMQIAHEMGFVYMGQDGEEYYKFGAGGVIMARGPSTPRNEGDALTFFRQRCAKALKPKPMKASRKVIDGNAAFRAFDRQK